MDTLKDAVSPNSHRLFQPAVEAGFLRRPNRFVIVAEAGGEELTAHCPNPGRMRELLLPGRRILLERSEKPGRRTPWTLAAVFYRNMVIPLHSARSNAFAGSVILPVFHPGRKLIPERVLGESRIDWKAEGPGDSVWIEVKACTLVERSRALFPDAPSIRAVRHLEELSSIAPPDRGEVLFTVMNPSARLFSPNPHTDPGFCRALASASERGVAVRAVSVRTDENGRSETVDDDLVIDLSSTDIAERDAGVILRVPSSVETGIHEVFVERCLTGLERALRRRRNPSEPPVTSLPIRGDMECFTNIEDQIANLPASCGGLRFETDPLTDPAFLDLVLGYRHERVFTA